MPGALDLVVDEVVVDEEAVAEGTGDGTLDPADWDAFRVQAHRMLDDMLGLTETIRERPLWQAVPADLRGWLSGPLPVEATALGEVHREFLEQVAPYALGNGHPGFMGWVHGGGTPVGMLAEMLAAGLNANLGGRDHAPMEIERQVTGWMRELFGFPAAATGLFVTGTSMANLLAVVVARDWAAGVEVRRKGVDRKGGRLVCYGSAGVHGCVAKALDVAGLGADALRVVETDGRGRICVGALTRAVRADRAAGMRPFLVVGCAGTVDTGAVDDLDGIAEVCREERLWFHVDGAFGALGMLAPEIRPRLKGIDRADSLAFDFHKWGQVPYDAGYLLVRDGSLQRQAFCSTAAYLERETRGMARGDETWPCDLGIDLSRGFRALKVWFTLKTFGAKALGAAIWRMCELARHLAQRIVQTPELELLVPVELNIVCFRYRSRCAAEVRDRINRQIAIDLQECGKVAPSTTMVRGCVALRACIANHRTSAAEIETLVEQTLVFGRALESAATQAPVAGELPLTHERNMLREALEAVERRLELTPDSTDLLFQSACLLDHTGQPGLASERYRRLLERDAGNMGALNNLGNLLLAAGKQAEALPFYLRAVEAEPGHVASRANLGNLLIKQGRTAEAAEQFEAALIVDENYRPAHAGLSFALEELGDPEAARRHRLRAFADRCVSISAYRGEKPPITVLELVSVTGGNFRTDAYLSDRVFQRVLVTTEFFKPGTRLPPHDLVVNAIGEADAAVEALNGALAVIAETGAPVINHPRAVLATGRCEIARRLAGIAGVRTAHTVLLRREELAGECAVYGLARKGLGFPLLLRTPGFHGGEHFAMVETGEGPEAGLAAALNELPGDELLAMEYLDARGADGNSRKYRVMMVGGELYPLHLAIAPQWKIHYFSADMAEREEHRAEEAAFLNDMAGVLGPRVMQALGEIQTTLGLDYGGIDFGLSRRGEVLVFEANATMAVIPPDQDARWDYRRSAVERVYVAVWEMLRDRAVRRAVAA
jgi:aromatic-L-amino-acid decarboxylase